MRRLVSCLLLGLIATAAMAAAPFSLDRNGVLWSASSQPEGLVLTAQRDGAVLLRSVVPFAASVAGASDSEIYVAADELTGKVAVVWQRNWSDAISEVMLGVWNNGAWERVQALSADMSAHPRYPSIQLSTARSSVTDPTPAIVEDSFLHVVWWEGASSSQHGTLAVLRLTAAVGEGDAVTTRSLDDFVWGSSWCAPAPDSVLERPLFASQQAKDRAYLFHGSRRACRFQILEISFRLEDPPAGGIIVTAQRRRHTPVFGVKKLYGVPASMSLEGARILVGADLVPVAYRVTGNGLEYISAAGAKWTERRSLSVDSGLTLDRAIPLVENLAH